MCPELKKEEQVTTKTREAELSTALQSRGMELSSLMGRPEIRGITGERGKAPTAPIQIRARQMVRGFLSKLGFLKK